MNSTMRTTVRLAIAVIAMMSIALVFSTRRASAQDCPAFDPGDPGKRFPVILIHGFNGDRSAMQPTRDALGGAGLDVHVVDFDYPCAKTEWVENPNIGLRLQNAIKELADKSMANGGPGKVAVIGHSMGGLATRQALAGGDLEGRMAFLATYGTPNLGSGINRVLSLPVPQLMAAKWIAQTIGVPLESDAGRSLQAFSEPIGRLQPFSGGFPVLALAGDYAIGQRIGWWTSTVSAGDMIVETPSAHAQQVAVDGVGGPERSVCELVLPYYATGPLDLVLAPILDHQWANRPDLANCYHNNLMKDPNLQRITVEQMRAVIDRTKARRPPKPKAEPKPPPATTVGEDGAPRRGNDYKATIVEFMERKANGLDTGDLGSPDAVAEAEREFARFAAETNSPNIGKNVGWVVNDGVGECTEAGDVSAECLVLIGDPTGGESPDWQFMVTYRAFGDDDPVEFCDGSLCDADGNLADRSTFRPQVVGVTWVPYS